MFTQAVLSGFNQKGTPTRTAAVALDLKRAFDTVYLNLLTEAMLKFNLPNSIKKWFSGYLTGREQKTNFDEIMTRREKLRSGVHHGVVISPFLCCWYLKGMPEPCNVEVVCCADDITVNCSHLYYKEAVKNIIVYLNDRKTFFHRIQLFPSPSKFSPVLLSISHSDWKEDLGIVLGTEGIKTVNNLTQLGVEVDPSLTFKDHVKDLVERASKRNNILQSLTSKSSGLQKEQLTTVYKAFTRSTFNYAAPC